MSTIIVTDGTTSVDMSNPSGDFVIVADGFQPAVAQRRDESDPQFYEEVDEEIRLMVTGASAAAAAANLGKLTQLIEAAQRWAEGDKVDTVVFQHAITNTGLASPTQAAVVGGPESGEIVTLPRDYDSATSQEVIGSASDPVIWRFRRRGAKLGPTETPSASSAADNPNIMSVTFTGNAALPSPVDLSLVITPRNSNGVEMLGGYLLVAEDSDDLLIVEGESGALSPTVGSGSFATQADSSKNARGGNVGRYTAANTDWRAIKYSLLSTTLATSRRVMMVAAVRQNDAARTWQIRGSVESSQDTGHPVDSRSIGRTIELNGSTDPQLVVLGAFSVPIDVMKQAYIELRVDDASGSPTLDIDYVVMMSLDKPTNRALHYLVEYNMGVGGTGPWSLDFEHRLLEHPQPFVKLVENTVTDIACGYDTPPMVFSRGTELAAVWLATYEDMWRMVDSFTKSTIKQGAITATRRIAYLTPV